MSQKHRYKNIIFVCVANLCRSPMAEGLAKKILGSKVKIGSAGLAPFSKSAAREAVEILKELYGIDISEHRPRAVTYISAREAAATSSAFTLQPSQELQLFAAPALEENEYVTIEVDDAIQGWRSMGVVVNQFDSNGFIQNNKRLAQQYRLTKSATRSSTRIESN